jgi:hypothetical protein
MTKGRNVGPIMYSIYGRYEYVRPITYGVCAYYAFLLQKDEGPISVCIPISVQ